MRSFRSAALAALIPVSLVACDVQIDVEPDRADLAAVDPLPDLDPDAEVWARRSNVAVFDESVAIDVRLALLPDGTYRLVTVAVDGSGSTDRGTSEGRWRRDGDRVVLTDRSGSSTTFRRRGEELELETEWPVDVVIAVTGFPDLALRRAR